MFQLVSKEYDRFLSLSMIITGARVIPISGSSINGSKTRQSRFFYKKVPVEFIFISLPSKILYLDNKLVISLHSNCYLDTNWCFSLIWTVVLSWWIALFQGNYLIWERTQVAQPGFTATARVATFLGQTCCAKLFMKARESHDFSCDRKTAYHESFFEELVQNTYVCCGEKSD